MTKTDKLARRIFARLVSSGIHDRAHAAEEAYRLACEFYNYAGGRASDDVDEGGTDVYDEPEDGSADVCTRMGLGHDSNGHTVFHNTPPTIIVQDGNISVVPRNQPVGHVHFRGSQNISQRWEIFGESASNPCLVTADPDSVITGVWSDREIRNVAFVGMQLGSLRFIEPGENLLVERCDFLGGGSNAIILQRYQRSGMWKNVNLRFNRVENYVATNGGHRQGFYLNSVDDYLIEYNCFKNNGINSVYHDEIRSHHIYISMPCSPGVIRRNVFEEAGGSAVSFRSGGTFEGNIVLNCPVGVGFGYDYARDTGETFEPAGGFVRRNIAIGSRDSGGSPRGMFVYAQHTDGMTVRDNFAGYNQTSLTNNYFVDFRGGSMNRRAHVVGNEMFGWGEWFRMPDVLHDLTASGNVLRDPRRILAAPFSYRPGDVRPGFERVNSAWQYRELFNEYCDLVGFSRIRLAA